MRRITWLGHSTVLIEAGGARLLTDPVLRARVAHLRRHAAPAQDVGAVDAILLSHQHRDHLDLATLRAIDAPLIVPRGAAPAVRALGREVEELAPGDTVRVGGAVVRAVPAVHDGRRLPVGPPVGALGYVVEGIYFAGDTETFPGMAERTAVVSSLSKSHALPGFRFGWIVGPQELAGHLFSLVLCMLYGGPPFIQDAAMVALTRDLPEAAGMGEAYLRRARLFSDGVARAPGCRAGMPEGGMFVLLDVRGTGLGSEEFARRLLGEEGVATLPCDGFGPSAAGHLRVSLAAPDSVLAEAARRVVSLAERLCRGA